MFNQLKNHDWIITIIIAIAAVISLLLIFAVTYNASNPQEGQGTVSRQVIFYIVGFIIYLGMSTLNTTWLQQRNIIALIYIAVFFSLVYLLFFGEVRANTQRWIFLGPLSFQPAEYAKIAIIIVTAYLFGEDFGKIGQEKERRNLHLNSSITIYNYPLLKKLSLSAILTGIYALLIFLQPSLGNALILTMIWSILMFLVLPITTRTLFSVGLGLVAAVSYFQLGVFGRIASVSYLNEWQWKVFTILALLTIFIALHYLFAYSRIILVAIFTGILLVAPLVDFTWNNVLKDYHRERIESFTSDFSSDPTGSDYQVRQSIIAIGAGRIWGRGYMQGTQSTLKTLPFAHTDFIFAALAEQFGFLGIIVLFGLYGLLIVRIIGVSLKTRQPFNKLLALGVVAIIIINIFVNTAMNLGLIPVTGVPLPLISHGGSSVLVIMISLGLVQMINNSLDTRDLTEKFTWIIEA